MTGGLTPASVALFAMAAVAALGDWVAVARDARRGADPGAPGPASRARLVTKPLVLVLLVGVGIRPFGEARAGHLSTHFLGAGRVGTSVKPSPFAIVSVMARRPFTTSITYPAVTPSFSPAFR